MCRNGSRDRFDRGQVHVQLQVLVEHSATHWVLWKGVLGGTLYSLAAYPTYLTLTAPSRKEKRLRTGRASDSTDTSALFCHFL